MIPAVESGLRSAEASAKSCWSAPCFVHTTTVLWLCFVAYVFSLATLSRSVNAEYGDASPQSWELNGLCTFPQASAKCYNGVNLTAAMIQSNRTHLCGCGQGVFGEGICDIRGYGFSLSYFISSTPATGMMVTSSIAPMLAMWFTQSVASEYFGEICTVRLARLVLLVFQVFYFIFLCVPVCQFPSIHGLASNTFIMSLTVHFALLAAAAACSGKTDRFVTWSIIVATAVEMASMSICTKLSTEYTTNPQPSNYAYAYAYWFGECITLSCSFGLGPVLAEYTLYQQPFSGTKPPTQGEGKAETQPLTAP